MTEGPGHPGAPHMWSPSCLVTDVTWSHPLVTSLLTVLTPHSRSDPDQVLWSSEQCWVTRTETCSAGGTSTGGGAGACLMMRKLIRIFRLCLYDLLSILWWTHHSREESKCVLPIGRSGIPPPLLPPPCVPIVAYNDTELRSAGQEMLWCWQSSSETGVRINNMRWSVTTTETRPELRVLRMTDGIHRVFCN